MSSISADVTRPSGGVDLTGARVRWSWLWGKRQDLLLTFLPFWLGFGLLGALFLTRDGGPTPREPGWEFSFLGSPVNVMAFAYAIYLPLIDGPHLWATISRTYVDAEEWAQRRWLFISALLAFVIGPVVILLPYLVGKFISLPSGALGWGASVWGLAFSLYVTLHINRQHWGFVALYRRKCGEKDEREASIDSRFFQTAIWLPYVTSMTGPWTGIDSSFASVVFTASHLAFVALCVAYGLFQLGQWRRGVPRNGPKLLYVTTILSLYYLTFAWHPRLLAFWILITGVGHCIQYQALVWTYGKKKYGGLTEGERRIPNVVFGKLWIYLATGVVFSLLTLRGPGGGAFTRLIGSVFATPAFQSALAFVDSSVGREVGMAVAAAFLAGLRVHHFYIDSKIWRVSKSKDLARNLAV